MSTAENPRDILEQTNEMLYEFGRIADVFGGNNVVRHLATKKVLHMMDERGIVEARTIAQDLARIDHLADAAIQQLLYDYKAGGAPAFYAKLACAADTTGQVVIARVVNRPTDAITGAIQHARSTANLIEVQPPRQILHGILYAVETDIIGH